MESARSVWLEDVQVLNGNNVAPPGSGPSNIGGSVVVISRTVVLEEVLISNGKSDSMPGGGCLASYGCCMVPAEDARKTHGASTLTITKSYFVERLTVIAIRT